jgi:hypothetical protein
MYPFWLSEGLATAFEINARQTLGPGAANPRRREGLLDAWRADRLIGLERFVAMMRIDTASQTSIRQAYGQAWGLFRYLLNKRPEAVKAYMQRLRHAGPGRRRAEDFRRDFEQAFGPVSEVEAGWRDWLASLAKE